MTVRKNRHGRWMVDVQIEHANGKIERVRKVAPVQTRRDAEAYEREVRRAVLDGTREKEEEPTKQVPRLRDFWSDFIEHQASNANKRTNRPRTIYESERIFERWIDPVLGGRHLDSIEARDADRLATQLESGSVTGRKLGAASVANALGLLRRMLSVARRWEIIDRVPEIDASKPKPDRIEDDEWLTREETASLFEAASEPWRAVMVLGFRSGLRVGELRGLRWADVDLQGQRIQIRRGWCDRTRTFGPPKSKRSREVPLSWDVVSVLRELPNGGHDALVFPGKTGVPFSRSSYARALELAAKAAKLSKHLHPHMGRHTFASHCIAAGIPTRIVMTWGGWETEAMLARYAHLAPREVSHFIDRIAPPGGPLRVVDGGAQRHPGGTSRGRKAKTAS